MRKKFSFFAVLMAAMLVLSGCNWLEYKIGSLKEQFVGRELTVQTYDENSQMIDRVQGKSVSIEADEDFSLKDANGDTVEKSSVLNITVGGKQMLHVGSSLIAYEDGLQNIFEEYVQKVDLNSFDRSVPFINRMVNDLQNLTTGKEKVVLIRSQSGQPLATFAGNDLALLN